MLSDRRSKCILSERIQTSTLRARGIREKYRYYREVAFLRGDKCEDSGDQVVADVIEAQVGELIENFLLPASWQKEIQDALDSSDQARENKEKWAEIEGKQRRLAELYADGMISKGSTGGSCAPPC